MANWGTGEPHKKIIGGTAYWLKRTFFVCSFVMGATASQWAMASSFMRFLDHTQRRTTVCMTPLDK